MQRHLAFLVVALVAAPALSSPSPAAPPAGISPQVPGTVTEAVIEAEARWVDDDLHAAAAAYRSALQAILSAGPEALEASLPEAELAIHRLVLISEETGETRELEEVLAKWAAGPPTAEHTAALARWYLGWAALDRGAGCEAARAIWAPLGFIEAWRVIGPFDNERNGNFLAPLAPETELDLQASHDGKKRKVSWRSLPARPPAGSVDLQALLVPGEQALAYALAFVRSESEADAALRFSSDEGIRIWWNRDLAASIDAERTHGFDLNSAPVRLLKGWNVILVKVPQTTGPWRFSVRITHRDGGPIAGISEGMPEPSELEALKGTVEVKEPPHEPAEETLEALRTLVEKDPSNARAHYVLGSLLLERQAHDSHEHPDTDALVRAIQVDDKPPSYHLALAQSHERDTSIAAEKEDTAWRSALEKAAARGSVFAEMRLAEHYLVEYRNAHRAHEHASRALAKRPDDAGAILLLGRAEEALSFPRALQRAREKAAGIPRPTVESRLEAARLAARSGKAPDAIAGFRTCLETRATDGGIRGELADLLLASGDPDGAARVLLEGAEIDPFATEWLLRVAGVEEGRDRLDAALENIERALAIRPEDHALQESKARVLARMGRKDAALAALDRALELQPNLPDVRKYAEFIRAAKVRFEDEFRLDAAPLVKAALERKDPNEKGDPARSLLHLSVVRVNRDGTTKEYVQDVVQVLNDRGLRMYDGYRAAYASGEQILEFRKGRVHHKDGTVSEAKLSRHGGDPGDDVAYMQASLDLPPLAVGDVVEVEYVTEDIAQSFFGDYFGRREIFQDEVPIDRKVFILRVPAERKFHFRARNLDAAPREEKDEAGGTVTYTWEKLDIPRLDPEPAMPGPPEVSPVLEVSTFESWKAFNDWYWNLIRKQLEVSPEISKKVKELVSGSDSDIDRIRAIYKFIVTDVRYNAWEFGVHGFKPYNAAAIFGRRFGDCKDKATLMTVMLKEAGIRSHPVLIYADQSRGAEDLTLPMINHFNHCITYVPPGRGHEEMYLDGTAQFHGFDELPSMDRGARVLVVRDDGGELRTVPWNSPADLSIEEEVTVKLRPDLGADLEVRARCEGDYAVYLRQSFEIAAQRRTILEQAFGRRYASANVKAETFSNLANLDEPVTFSVTLDAPRFALEAPEGLALRAPEDFFGSGRSLAGIGSLESRKQDVLLSNPRRSVLRTIYEIPEGFRVKSLPRDSAIEGRFGRLQVEYRQEDPRRIVFERAIEITSPRVPLSEYASFREFAAAINRLEQDRILLEKT